MPTRRFSPLNRYEYASILCSLLIICVPPFVDQYLFRFFPEGYVPYIIFTIPLGIIPFILAWLGKSVRCGVLACIAAFFPYLLMCAMFMGAGLLYIVSGGRINPV